MSLRGLSRALALLAGLGLVTEPLLAARGAEPPPAADDAPAEDAPAAAPPAGAPPADAPAPEAGPASGGAPATKPAGGSRQALAAASVSEIPEIGQCRREPLRSVVPVVKAEADLTPEELKQRAERKEFDATVERFAAASKDYQDEVGKVLDRSFKSREKGINRRFDKQASEVELELRQRRLEAIRRFEAFVAKYPDDPAHTPDAMFRLAELYYERSAVDFADAQDRYQEERSLYERGKIPSEPQAPTRDYGDSVRIYRQLLGRFGERYRYADAVHYLLGYVLQESGDDLEARKTWLALVERYPKSEYAPEVYLRIGESHFDYGEFAEAAAIYQKALAYPDSRFYDKALYKLAWTYFQVYDYDRAIRTFKELIAYYDKQGADGTTSALREEAIDYLAKSLAEDDWDNDGLDDPNSGVGRALAYLSDGNAYENDIVAKYAESLYDLHDKKKYEEAIEVYRELIHREPTALKAVSYQQQIIKIYDIMRDIDAATRERQKLAEMFAPGSEWARENKGHLKQVNDAMVAVESAMRRRALFLHQRAQELKTQAKLEDRPELYAEAADNYTKAARAYEDYLLKYPTEPASYEMRFYLAETLYYSDQFAQAAATYFEVAGDPNQAKFREPAAWSAVKAYERLLKDGVAAGRLPDKADPNSPWSPAAGKEGEEGAEIRAVTAEPYPPEVSDWMRSIDFYVLRDIQREGSRKPQVAFAYQAAEMAMRYHDDESARDRFRQVIACFPGDELAADAMANILNIYRDENDLPNLEKWANIADRLALGDPEQTEQIRKKIKVFKLGAQFQRAESLLAAGQQLEAAREFERLADQNPDAKFLDKAYYNAAMAYKEVKYYESASRIFEKLVTDPRFKDSSFYNESLFELAENYKLFFNFEKAVTTYQQYFSRTQGSSTAQNRPYALFTMARLQEYSGDLAQAAHTYERYAETFEGRPDSANALFAAAEIYDDLEQRADQRRVLHTFTKKFSGAQGMGTNILEATLKLGDLAMLERKPKDAEGYYQDVLREYEARGFQPGTAAAAAAAEAKFKLVERKFDVYERIKLTEGMSQKRMSAELARKQKLLSELELAYGEVLPYKSLDWNIAAFYRLGDIYRDFAKTLYKAPVPRGLSDDELDVYYTTIEDEGLKYENVAIERFERTVKESGRLKVTNDWARLALEAINQYKPQDYPLFKETKKAPTFEPVYRVDPSAGGAP